MAIKDPSTWFRKVNKKIDGIDTSMDDLYKYTYASRSDNKRSMESIVSSIDNSIDTIINKSEGPKISDMSNLYMRVLKKKGISSTSIVNSAMELFSDNNILNSLSANQDINGHIYAEDYQYDLICKYMPAIETALDIKKDNVLSSDNFTKEFLSIESSALSTDKLKYFTDNAKIIEQKYKFQDICEEMYQRASKYGECFLYIVPYHIAMERLLKQNNSLGANNIYYNIESGNIIKTKPPTTVIFESSKLDDELKQNLKEVNGKLEQDSSVNIIFNDTPIISEPIRIRETADNIKKKSKLSSLSEAFQVFTEAKKEDPAITYQSVFNTKKSKSGLESGINDGLVVNGGAKADTIKINETNGCIVSFIERGDVIPIYMDDLCVGYYHFSFNQNADLNTCPHGFQGTNTPIFGSNSENNLQMQQDMTNDVLLGYVSQKISDSIDAHFINANLDLKEEIYAILKFNDKFNAMNGTNNVTVSFIPADDIFHFYLKLNKKTHRGISSIHKSIMSAMMYIMLNLTTTIGQVTRGVDKRLYYVKQNVETNVARTMINVINQLKRGNMGMRQIQSMNSILNIVGKYNDHIIPVGPSGDPPIQFEVMEGQRIETPTELMERYQNDAVASTDVPYEFVQNVDQVDYATRFTMSNSKFLRKVYKEQRICQDAFSAVYTKIYNYEFGENERCIKVLLPAPAFLSMTNSEQLMSNTRNYIQAIADSELASESDEVKNEFMRVMTRSLLGNYVDYSKVDDAVVQAKLNVATTNKTEEE